MEEILISTTSNNEYILLEKLNNVNSGITNVKTENKVDKYSIDAQTIIAVTVIVISIAQLAVALYELKNTTKDKITIKIQLEMEINNKDLHEIEDFLKKEFSTDD